MTDLIPQEREAVDRLERGVKVSSDQFSSYQYVLVMDQASQSVFHRLGSQRIAGNDIQAAVNVFRQVVKQTKKLHAKNLLHFDIKPRNILFRPTVNTSDDEIVLCDLDASMPLDQLRSQDDKPGSSAYYAPEVARWVEACNSQDGVSDNRELKATPALDVWSLGALLFELCSGQHLFSQDISDDSMVNDADMTRLCVWLCMPEEQLKLVCHKDTNLKQQANARHLVRWMLQGDPELRPSLDNVLDHELLGGTQSTPRVDAEERYVRVEC